MLSAVPLFQVNRNQTKVNQLKRIISLSLSDTCSSSKRAVCHISKQPAKY